ncbi:MAG: ATP-binding protein, partial [Proteobacteria bacterium]|nr:ATP-binding protein [Pseudomonadota bacterium]
APERTGLLEAIAALRQQSEELGREERETRLRTASDLVRDVASVNELRIRLIPQLSGAKRQAVLGLTREGLAQLGREIRHVLLMARWYPLRLLGSWTSVGSQVRDFFAVSRASWVGLKLAVLLAGALVVRRRYEAWLRALRRLAVTRVRNRSLNLVADRWLRFAAAVADDVGLLLFLYAFFALLGLHRIAELDVMRAVLLGYAWYRFLIAAVHHAVAAAAGTGRVSVSAALSDRILRSVRLVGRYGYAVAVVLLLSRHALGRGYLYHLVVRFFWLGAFPLAFVLIQRWRNDITSAYLRLYPKGRFAAAVGATRDRPEGFFVAAAAFCSVAARGMVFYGRETLLRFEQTRRALAFLFRRRLEKQAESIGLGTSDVQVLPEALRKAFSEAPVGPELAIPRYPYLEEVQAKISEWALGPVGSAVAVVGERGIGKTSWLAELERRTTGLEVIHVRLEDRFTTPHALCRHLGQALDLGETDTGTALIRAAATAPRRLVLLDQAQNLILRAPDGLRGYDAFNELVAGTWNRLFWVCTFSRYAWQHVDNVYRGRNLFRTIYRLETWPEEDIGALIERRMRATGSVASYEDLVVDRVDGTEFRNEVIRTGERYRRLLWDYADGNPRVAVHFWLRSLVPDGGNRVRVRLFAAPGADELDALQEQARFLLAAVVTHENLSVPEAVRILRYPPHLCEAGFNYLLANGLVEATADRYRVTVHWNRAVIRFLRRKHLLFS